MCKLIILKRWTKNILLHKHYFEYNTRINLSKMNKVLIIATSRQTKGGISSVIRAYEGTLLWKYRKVLWLESHLDKGNIFKIFYFIKSLSIFLFIAPYYKIVHIHLSEPASLKRKQFFYYLAKFYGCRIIVHFHSFSIETTINGVNNSLYKKIFSGSDKVIVLSKQWEKWVTQLLDVSKEKVAVLYNPCPPIKTEHKSCTKEKIILFAGALNERKGYQDLLNAFLAVSKTFPEWKLVFAGNGDLVKCKQEICNMGLEGSVDFVGWVSGTVKAKYFEKASVFCLPSYAEGFPMAVLDAWAYGLPVITTPVGGLPDILEHGKNALVFDPGDVETLSFHLAKLISNEGLRKALAKESIKLSDGIFNIKILAQQLEYIYKSIE